MRGTAIIEKDKKLLKHGTRKPIIPWINYFGANLPPVNCKGVVLKHLTTHPNEMIGIKQDTVEGRNVRMLLKAYKADVPSLDPNEKRT